MKHPQSKRAQAFNPKPVTAVITVGPGLKISKPPKMKLNAGANVGFVVLNNDVVARTVWIDPANICDTRFAKNGRCTRDYKASVFVRPLQKVHVPAGGVGLLRQRVAPPLPPSARGRRKRGTFEYTITMGNEKGRKVFELDPEGDVSPPVF